MYTAIVVALLAFILVTPVHAQVCGFRRILIARSGRS